MQFKWNKLSENVILASCFAVIFHLWDSFGRGMQFNFENDSQLN